MNVIVCIVTTAVVVFVSAVVVARLRLPGVLRSLLALGVVACAYVMAVVLVAGTVLDSLSAKTLVGTTTGSALTVVALVVVRSGWREVWSVWSTLWRRCTGQLRDWRVLGRSLRENPVAVILAVMALGQTAAAAAIAWVFPPYAWDGLSYHLPAVAHWVQNERIGFTPYWIYTNVYPMNAELVFTWPTVLMGNDTLADAGQLPFALLGAIAVAVIARALGVRRSLAVVAACMFVLTPIVVMQMSVAYSDVALAGLFLAAFAFWFCALQELGLVGRIGELERVEAWRLARIDLVLGGLAAGMAVGTKSVGIAYVGVLAAVLAGLVVVAAIRRERSWRSAVAAMVLFAAPLPVFGGFWYARTWVEYGNPLHPFTVSVLGRDVFSGIGPPEQTVLAGMAPPSIVGRPWPEQVWASWTSAPKQYTFDSRLGGLGLAWLYGGLPALALFMGYALKRRRDLFCAVVVPFSLIFVLQPLRWWSRFTVVLAGVGALALVFMIERVARTSWRKLAIVLQFAALGLVLAVTGASARRHTSGPTIDWAEFRSTQAIPAEERTIGRVLDGQFAWVDNLRDGDTIVTRLRDVPNAWVYPLLGRRYQNHLVMLPDVDDVSTLEMPLESSRGDYLLAATGGTLDRLVQQMPTRYRLFVDVLGSRIYQILR